MSVVGFIKRRNEGQDCRWTYCRAYSTRKLPLKRDWVGRIQWYGNDPCCAQDCCFYITCKRLWIIITRKNNSAIVRMSMSMSNIDLLHGYLMHWMHLGPVAPNAVKEVDLYSAFIAVPHTQGVQVRIIQFYLQITPYLPLPRKHSPDGDSPDWGCGQPTFIYPERMKGWVSLVGWWHAVDGLPT